MTKLLSGKKGLIMGVANDMSMAWAIAKKCYENGAEIAMPYAMPALEKRVRPLAESINADFVMETNVQDDNQMDKLFSEIEKKWGKLDFVLHAIAFSDKNELRGFYKDTTRENFKNTMEISVYSLVDITRRATPLLKEGGSIACLTYFGSEKVIPNYNVMGVAKAGLEASVRYLASDVGVNGIRVNAISAGPILTLSSSAIGNFKAMLSLNSRLTPLKRNMTLDDVAKAAVFLFSDLSSGTTGEVLHTDCGYNTTGMLGNDLKDLLTNAITNEDK